MGNPISFPGFGIGPFDPSNTIPFFGFNYEIHWYGVIIAIGFMLAFMYAMKRCEQFGYNQDQLIDILFIGTPIAILCARAYFVLFHFDLFRSDPISVFKIWNGGLAIYGAVIGGLLAGAIIAKMKKIKIGALLDLSVLGFMIGQAIGRWGNFMNREAYGTATNLPWRMEITDFATGMRMAVHPCFLYESLWNALGFLILHFVSKKRKYDGQIFLMYLAWYGFGRGIIEGFRTDSLFIPGTLLRASQVFGFASCIIALLILVFNAVFRRFDPENMQAFRYKAVLQAASATKADDTAAVVAEDITPATADVNETGAIDANLAQDPPDTSTSSGSPNQD